ncbi:MAG: enoyl-CoA hydratase, partial [Rhodobacteraceae bacterium]|nr:enoyl-CoA hydratase [Paracoccaceae bacterium]
ALELGRMNQIVPAESLAEAARGLAQRIIRPSPAAVARILAAVTRGQDLPLTEGLRIESDQFELVAAQPDCLADLDRWLARPRE